ncbi:MAG: hypothetical protein HY673_18970 [Chloroflexi bacterium]|nr:hypothetical protein [Chloroflexota bacterium]
MGLEGQVLVGGLVVKVACQPEGPEVRVGLLTPETSRPNPKKYVLQEIMMSETESNKRIADADAFTLELWYLASPDTYEQFWKEGIKTSVLLAKLINNYPSIHNSIQNEDFPWGAWTDIKNAREQERDYYGIYRIGRCNKVM